MIEVLNVSRSFGTFKAVDNVSFSIPTGQIVGLLGPNGAGKTTTMRMITGFLAPSSGTIKIDGMDISREPVEAKKKIGYMSESAPLYTDMIVEDYLRYSAEIHNVDADVKIPELCNTCGLSEVMHKNIGELSKGYKQRVGLANALIHDPEILILDEPTSGLDPNQIEDVRSLIKEIGKTRTVIISTHILGEVEMICSRVIIISKGQVVAHSPTENLHKKARNTTVINITAAGCSFTELTKAIAEIEGAGEIMKADAEKISGERKVCAAAVTVEGGKEIRGEIFTVAAGKGWRIYSMGIQKNSLEDVFHVLTQDSLESSEENS